MGAEEGKPEGWKMVRESFLERVTPEVDLGQLGIHSKAKKDY